MILRENLLDKRMGAPGLAFETWDPPRKCRRTRVLTHIPSGSNVRENSALPAFAWRIPGLKSETWGTHPLIQEVQSNVWAKAPER